MRQTLIPRIEKASQFGHLNILKHLIETIDSAVNSNDDYNSDDILEANDFYAFQLAAEHGKLDIIKYFEEKKPHQLQNMIAANDFWAIRMAILNHQTPVVQRLLNHPNGFAYTEAHQHEFQEQILAFVTQKLTTLRTRQQEAEANNLDTVFEVTSPDEAKLLFYVARNLIRRNDVTLIDDLRFLLNIPAVNALALTAVTPHRPNELLRLALSVGNQDAANVLLNIPALRILAEQNNYYQQKQQAGLDVAAIAADHESSMTALTQGEQEQLEAISNRYQPLLTRLGLAATINNLRHTLKLNYEADPATLTIHKNDETKKSLTLPLLWSDFEALNLNPEQTEQAFKAYYKNKNHTAWRYL